MDVEGLLDVLSTLDEAQTRGLMVLASVILATGALTLTRLRKRQPERVIVNVDAPPGQKVSVVLGDRGRSTEV